MDNQYSVFAYIYDRLMEDVDYYQWANYVEKIIKENNSKTNNILEMACGTGNVTIPLKKGGYNITGLDISESMLTIAKEKSVQENLDILFINQDMTLLDLHKKYDCILCMCDGINYILDNNDLEKVFRNVYNALKEDGTFIFDISSSYKLKNILGNNTFGESLEDLTYLWENYYDEDNKTIEMDLTFFIKKGEYYKKEEEYHIQRAYEIHEITEKLKKIDFKTIKTYDEFTFEPPKEKSERVFFIAKK